MTKKCFVIMPIGDQTYYGLNGEEYDLKENELQEKYEDLIKDSIEKANSNYKVKRADDIYGPGSITEDIFKRLMKFDYVIADITYPNPNVFYELGIRHAYRTGTILLKDKKINIPVPFDIRQYRYTEYTDTSTGRKKLIEAFKKHFAALEKKPNESDNHFLKLAEPKRNKPLGSIKLWLCRSLKDEEVQQAPPLKLKEPHKINCLCTILDGDYPESDPVVPNKKLKILTETTPIGNLPYVRIKDPGISNPMFKIELKYNDQEWVSNDYSPMIGVVNFTRVV